MICGIWSCHDQTQTTLPKRGTVLLLHAAAQLIALYDSIMAYVVYFTIRSSDGIIAAVIVHTTLLME